MHERVGQPTAGFGDTTVAFWITQADAGRPASERVHVGFHAPNRDAVDAFYREALDAGGHDLGTPGYRPTYGADYYAAYVTDPDGNNVEAVHHELLGLHTPPSNT